MKISIKTLKGELFQIEADGSDQVSVLKDKIQESRSDLAAARQKLIHAGKVLKDDQTIEQLNVSESDFIVCMLTKETAKKPAPVAAASVPTPAAAPTSAPAGAAAAPFAAPTAAGVVPAPTAHGVSATPNAAAATTTAAAPAADAFVTAEGIQALTGMGFPESESRAALTAAMGNADLAYEFLLTGIPDQLRNQSAAAAGAAPAAAGEAATAGSVGIEQLRSHPQFNRLKQLVQSNPAALSQVLEVIGQQSPALLAAIHANNDAFLAMMNEPITDDPAPAAAAAAPMGGLPAMGMGAGGGNPMADPAQLMTMLQAMPAQHRAQFAQHLGMTPEQLEGFMSMLSSMPPEQMQSILGSASRMTAAGGAAGADPPGVIRLTEEEMAAVNRLQALGFSQQQAAQAYLACDKNEEQAANLLFDGGWGDEDMGFGGGGGGGGDDDGGDDMYS